MTLVILAFGDLIAGVTNDAVNFLNSAIGSRAAGRKVILGVATAGILAGVLFSDGIIEVARKGIFNPGFFTQPEALLLFAAVALADIILLDLYSTYGLPTSTTVAVVFELLGAALALALWKTGDLSVAWTAINSSSALRVIVGILLSVAVALLAGLAVQTAVRAVYTFDFGDRIRRWGFIWSGLSLSALTFFLLLKGAKHASFMTPDLKAWIAENTLTLFLWSFLAFSALSWLLIKSKFNILKLLVLIGTGALAAAFAGNDLANFIGVSVAGVNAFLGNELTGKLPTPLWVLVLAGLTMAAALNFSRKARSVTETEIHLTSHQAGGALGKWRPNRLVKALANMFCAAHDALIRLTPRPLRNWLGTRWRRTPVANRPDFDLLRASVNLTVAASVIAFATSQKLPLSTTYVTFMVAMGTSLADRSWGRDCAAHRLTGTLVVIGGWFITALLAMIFAGFTVSVLYLTGTGGLIALVALVLFLLSRMRKIHRAKA
jgi:phosphate/sulfate permease